LNKVTTAQAGSINDAITWKSGMITAQAWQTLKKFKEYLNFDKAMKQAMMTAK